ncbi:hypothetical protein H0X32_00655 [Patescibacteria group bacterium]|nr:hypothetical protein [Patescibacteria group bacterium]
MTVAASHVTNEKFDETMSKLFDMLEVRFSFIDEQFRNLWEVTRNIELRVIKIEYSLEEIKENLSALTEAEGKDALASINHEHRISALERRSNIKPNSPQHLLELD